MEELIKQAFLHVEVIGPQVQNGYYDLIGPAGEIILPSIWEKVIQPDWSITMHMWPLDKQPQRPGMMQMGGGHPQMQRPGGHPGQQGGQLPAGMRLPPGFMAAMGGQVGGVRPSGAGAVPGPPPPPPGFRGMPGPQPGMVMNGGRGGNPMIVQVGPEPGRKKKSSSSKQTGSVLGALFGGKPSKSTSKK